MTQPLQLALAEKLKAMRSFLSLTQRQVAEAAGITPGTYFLAEAYGRVGLRARRKLETWLSKQEAKRDKRK